MAPSDRDERELDDALKATFPASDPISNTAETGVHVGLPATPSAVAIHDNAPAHRFEAQVEGRVAVLEYERRSDALVLNHTEVPAEVRQRGVGSQLAEFALQAAEAEGLRVIARCPFVRAYLRRRPARPSAR